jgi:pteridine reductase
MKNTKPAILITGGTKRLGIEFARTSLQLGFSVILHYRTSTGDAKEQLTPLTGLSDDLQFIQQDLDRNPEKLIQTAFNLNPHICGLVNNVAEFTTGNLSETQHFEHLVSINALIPNRLTAVFTRMAGTGWVINITDANIHHTNKSYQNYRISKLLHEELTRQQAVLYAPHVRVNALAPGAMLPSEGKEDYFNKLADTIPLKSTGNIRSLTEAYTFLIKNEYITGQVLRIDGGWSLI